MFSDSTSYLTDWFATYPTIDSQVVYDIHGENGLRFSVHFPNPNTSANAVVSPGYSGQFNSSNASTEFFVRCGRSASRHAFVGP